jgi:acyl carrier protein
MKDGAIQPRLETLCRDVVGIPVESDQEDLIDSGVLDSLVLVQLLMAIEEEFQVKMPTDELELDRLRTTRSIGLYIAELKETTQR